MAIFNCDCKDEFCDERYGKGKRVHNVCKNKSSGKNENLKCATCLKIKEGANKK